MSESNLSISYQAPDGCFKSKNARKRLKEELKKSYNLLENKEDFMLIPNDKTGYFTKFLNQYYKLELVKNQELDYTVKIVQDENELKRIKEEEQKNKNREAIRNKLRNMKDVRSNTMGRKIKDMRKEMGDDMVKKFLRAQQSLGGNTIPDPSEIMKNKGKYLEQFKEYQKMIQNMKEQNPQTAAMLEGNDYHKYASAILEKLELD